MITDRSHIQTEQVNPDSVHLDAMSITDAIALMNRQDAQALAAVAAQQSAIATAVAWVAQAFTVGGRLIYFGAGTSGRLGVLDASECPPTFCTDPSMVVGVIAGGNEALRRSIENIEDDRTAGAQAVRDLNIGPHDIAFGIAAGGTTPYVHGALIEAKARGAKTIFLICTKPEHVHLFPPPDLFIALDTGPEILTGSTRLKAGTATKLVLNTVTTLAMVQIGKTFGHYMVDMDALKNSKLIDRGIRMLTQIAQLPRDQAHDLLLAAKGNIKRALVMHYKKCTLQEADQLLMQAHGRLRKIIDPE